MKSTPLDISLHAISIQIAAAIKTISTDAFNQEVVNQAAEDAIDDLVMAFRCIRRHINIGDDGKRFGATAAYNALRNGEI